jgi:hypothetical protein
MRKSRACNRYPDVTVYATDHIAQVSPIDNGILFSRLRVREKYLRVTTSPRSELAGR